MLSLFIPVYLVAVAHAALLRSGSSSQTVFSNDVKVPVTLGVMSHCPDALLCESVWNDVLQRVGDRVNISLSFIGRCVRGRPD